MKVYAAYDRDGLLIAQARSIHSLADMIGRHFTAVSHGLHRGSPLHAAWEEDDEPTGEKTSEESFQRSSSSLQAKPDPAGCKEGSQ